MAIMATLELEEKVQVKDKTRLSGSKSFITKGETDITTMTITPGVGGPAINVFLANTPEEWYTDWQWSSWTFDVDSTNYNIDFEEGGVDYAAQVASGAYTTYAALVTAIETALNAAGASGTFTVSINEENKITISSTVAFSLLPYTGANRFNGLLTHIGWDGADTDSSLSQTGNPIEYGLRKVVLAIGNGVLTDSATLYQKVYSEEGDRLFSSDSELLAHEEDILKWVPPGRNSFKDVHRRVQTIILDWLEGQGFVNVDRLPFTKFDFYDLKEMREWATMMALHLIFEGNSNAVDDIFDKKARMYSSLVNKAKYRFLAVDIDQDGKIDFDENLRLHTGNLFRR